MVPDYFNAELDLLNAVPLNRYPQRRDFLCSGIGSWPAWPTRPTGCQPVELGPPG